MVAMRNESQLPAVGRLVWMMVGPAIALLAAVHILNSPRTGWLTFSDFMYGFALLITILGRWVEHRGGTPKSGTGEPATDQDFRNYVVLTVIVGVGIWIAANLLSNYVL